MVTSITLYIATYFPCIFYLQFSSFDTSRLAYSIVVRYRIFFSFFFFFRLGLIVRMKHREYGMSVHFYHSGSSCFSFVLFFSFFLLSQSVLKS